MIVWKGSYYTETTIDVIEYWTHFIGFGPSRCDRQKHRFFCHYTLLWNKPVHFRTFTLVSETNSNFNIFFYPYRVDSNLTVKLTDTALSRDLFPNDYHCLGDNENRPVKWLSLEALLDRRFSVGSEVVSTCSPTLYVKKVLEHFDYNAVSFFSFQIVFFFCLRIGDGLRWLKLC